MRRASDLVIQTFELQGHRFLRRDGRSLVFKRDGAELRIYVFREKLTSGALAALPEGRKVVVCLSGWEPDVGPSDSVTELWDKGRFFSLLGESMFEVAMNQKVTSHIFKLPRDRKGKPHLPEGKDEGIVHNNVDQKKAEELGRRVEGFSHELRLVPWFVLDLSYKEQDKERAISIAVDAITGRSMRWNSMLVLKDDIAWPHSLQEPKLSADDAIEKAMEAVISIEGKRSRFVKEEFETVTVVDRVTSFDRSSIRLIRIGLFHFPIWVIEGVKGVMIINGFTGDVIEESFLEDDADDTAK